MNTEKKIPNTEKGTKLGSEKITEKVTNEIFTPEEYAAAKPTERFPTPRPNIEKAQVKGAVIDVKGYEYISVSDKTEVKTRKGRFLMKSFQAKFPKWKNVNLEAILEAVNRSDRVSDWYAEANAEFAAQISFPGWLAEQVKAKDIEVLQDKIRDLNNLRREQSQKEAAIARNIKDVVKMTREVTESASRKIMTLSNGSPDWLAFIVTLPASQLPLRHVFDVINFTAHDATKTLEMVESEKKSGSYISPASYEDFVLDKYKKYLYKRLVDDKALWSVIAEDGLDFEEKPTFMGDVILSDISVLTKRDASSMEALGLPGSAVYRTRSPGTSDLRS